MPEVMTCMHHPKTDEEHSCQEVQSKFIHVCASSSSENILLWHLFHAEQSKFYWMGQQLLQEPTWR